MEIQATLLQFDLVGWGIVLGLCRSSRCAMWDAVNQPISDSPPLEDYLPICWSAFIFLVIWKKMPCTTVSENKYIVTTCWFNQDFTLTETYKSWALHEDPTWSALDGMGHGKTCGQQKSWRIQPSPYDNLYAYSLMWYHPWDLDFYI